MSWVLYRANIRKGQWSRRETAMNAARKLPWRPGKLEVVNHRTGETWERRRGSWFKTSPARAGKRASA